MIRLIDSQIDKERFAAAVEPLMEYLAKHYHPHVTVIVTSATAELLEGIKTHVTYEFVEEASGGDDVDL